MKNRYNMLAMLLCVVFSGCDMYRSPEKNIGLDQETGNTNMLYVEQYDPISDQGQYVLPEMKAKPKKFWSCVEVVGVGSRNDVNQTEAIRGIQYHLLCQSITGLANRAVDEGKCEIGVWMYDHNSAESYKLALDAVKAMGISEQGMQSGRELALNDYSVSGGIEIQLKGLFDGYVLTDVKNNPESAVYAAVASHVYNSLIVDIRDKAGFDDAGYAMMADARTKSTADAWREFKDKCNNEALVVMPVQTGELRDYAIKNGLFVLNINKKNGTSSGGQNLDIFDEILRWLAPGAPVLGWENGLSEDFFVGRASRAGHPWIPSDWCYNMCMTSLLYKSRQTSVLAKVDNPQFIDFDKKKNFVSFLLSDGDNIQWIMGSFVSDYFQNPDASDVKMGFGVGVSNLTMIAPSQFADIIGKQQQSYTIIEALGGGYLYVDDFGSAADRTESLREISARVAANMRQHRVKVLALIARDVMSEAAQEGFRAYINANDQLEGIIAFQYSPYAGGAGEIMWVTNSKGYDIPVITVKYSLWNFGNYNAAREGTPAYIANKLKTEAGEQTFSAISVHAWSSFRDIGDSNDELAENTDESDPNRKFGAGAAKLCKNRLDDRFEVVGVQELIWRVRMHYRPEQTKKYLSEVF